MPNSAERRAQRALEARAYRYLPSREVLQAATQLEQTKMESATRDSQLTLQAGSLAVAVLSQVPREPEENKPVFIAARGLLVGILERAKSTVESLDHDDDELVADEADVGADGVLS
jgi:hypothetical protein